MRRLLLPLLLLPACAASPATTGVETEPVLRTEPSTAAPFDDRLPPKPEKAPHPPVHWAFDVLHYDIDVALDFDRSAVAGSVTVSLKDREDGLDTLTLHAAEMEIRGVVDADGTPVAFRHEGDQLLLPLPGGSQVGRERGYTIVYAATPARGLHFIDAPAGHEDWGRQVWSQGECEDTRYWLPCHDAPDDRATHSMSVRVPRGMTVTAAGERVGVDAHDDDTETWHFDMTTAHVSYLITLVAGDLIVVDDDTGPVPLEFVANHRHIDNAVTSLRRTSDVLELFGKLTKQPYPYKRYAQCCVRDFVFGGMENITATTLTETTVHPEDFEPLKSSDGLVAHEAAHQWFGDLITCSHWSHIWLNEGFATYFTQLWREHAEGRDAFLAAIRGTMNGALGACERARRPVVSDVYAQPFDLFFDGHAYGGGAARLHALRHELGDGTFFRAIRHYVEQRAGTVVTTDDFERAVSEAAGRDMGWWFDQWLHSPGRPKLKVRWSWDADAGALIVKVEQTQNEKGFPKVYRLSLDVVLDLPDGTTVERRLPITERGHSFSIVAGAKPLRVRLDPARGLLARLDVTRSLAEWLDLATLDPSPAGRLDAIGEVGKAARAKKASADRDLACRAIARAVVEDPRHEVRRAAVDELKRVRDETRLQLLADRASNDPDLRVRKQAIDALGDFDRDPAAAKTLTTIVRSGPEALRPAALRALAKIGARGAYELLEAALESPGWQSGNRAAALNGFADLGDESAFATLVGAARRDADPWTRDEALDALARMGATRPEYTDAVLVHLGDSRRSVREAAARALGKLGDPGAVPALMEAWRHERWPRSKNALRKAIIACRKAAVESGRLVTVEAVRAARLRAEHAAARDGGDTKAARVLRKQLDALGVPPLPKPPK